MKQHVVEIVTFRLNADVSESAFLSAAAQADTAIKKLPGFIRRNLSRDETGNWIDYVLWESTSAAQNAGEIFHTLPETQEFCGMIDMSQTKMSHLGLALESMKAA